MRSVMTPRSRGPGLMFHGLAAHYDALLAGKNYRAEAVRLRHVARRYGRSGGKRWLDLACGTGRHLEFLRPSYTVEGVDASAQMLRLARPRLPGVRLTRADMRTVRLGRRFDVVSCLFGVLGHLRSEAQVEELFARIAALLVPGGVALVEPWIDPSEFVVPGVVDLMTARRPGSVVVRLSSSSRRRNRATLDCHYLVGVPGRAVAHFHEVEPWLLVPRARLLALMRAVGLRPRYLRAGLRTGRGLLVGVKPVRGSAP